MESSTQNTLMYKFLAESITIYPRFYKVEARQVFRGVGHHMAPSCFFSSFPLFAHRNCMHSIPMNVKFWHSQRPQIWFELDRIVQNVTIPERRNSENDG